MIIQTNDMLLSQLKIVHMLMSPVLSCWLLGWCEYLCVTCYSATPDRRDYSSSADWRTWHSTDWRKVCSSYLSRYREWKKV